MIKLYKLYIKGNRIYYRSVCDGVESEGFCVASIDMKTGDFQIHEETGKFAKYRNVGFFMFQTHTYSALTQMFERGEYPEETMCAWY